MKLICIPQGNVLMSNKEQEDLRVILYSREDDNDFASVGAAIKEEIIRRKLRPALMAGPVKLNFTSQ